MNRIAADIAAAYAESRLECLKHPALALQSADTQLRITETVAYTTIWYSGVREGQPGALQIEAFIGFCEAAARCKSYEDALELERNHDAGQEL